MAAPCSSPDDPVPPTGKCANCSVALAGEWCHQCGQRALDTKAGTWWLIQEWFADTFDTDARIPRTILPFFFRPGWLVSEYLAGRRATYTTPLRVYVFSALVSFFVLSSVAAAADANLDVAAAGEVHDEPAGTEPHGGGMRITIDRPPDEAVGWFDDRVRDSADRLAAMPKDQAGHVILMAFFDAAPKVLSLLLPVFAGVLKLFWPGRTFFEHAIFSLNIHALVLIVLATCSVLPSWAFVGGLAVVQIHLVAGLWRVYAPTRWGIAFRYAGIVGLYGMVLLVAAVFTLLVAVIET